MIWLLRLLSCGALLFSIFLAIETPIKVAAPHIASSSLRKAKLSEYNLSPEVINELELARIDLRYYIQDNRRQTKYLRRLGYVPLMSISSANLVVSFFLQNKKKA